MIYYKGKGISKTTDYDLWVGDKNSIFISLFCGYYSTYRDVEHKQISEKEFNSLKEEYIRKGTQVARETFTSNKKYTEDFDLPISLHGLYLNIFNVEVNDKTYKNIRCFDPVKTSGDIILQVPDWRLNLFGYKKEDFEEYLNFLTDVNDLHFSWEEKEAIEQDSANEEITEHIITNTIVFSKHTIYRYRIGSNDESYNYVHALLVRYALHPLYRNIARYCLEMRKVLPKKVTNSEILLLAHYSGIRDSFYALTGHFPDISQSFNDIIVSYRKGKKLNDSVKKGPIIVDVDNYFKKKKFKELYKLVK